MLISTVDGGHVIAGVAEYFGVPPPHVGSCQLSQDGWLAPTEVSFVECLTSYLTQHISTLHALSSKTSTTFLFLIDRYRVIFFNWASPEFAKCWPVSNRFQKDVRVPDWPPP